MKKFFRIFVLGLLVLSLVGCAAPNGDPPDSGVGTQPGDPPSPFSELLQNLRTKSWRYSALTVSAPYDVTPVPNGTKARILVDLVSNLDDLELTFDRVARMKIDFTELGTPHTTVFDASYEPYKTHCGCTRLKFSNDVACRTGEPAILGVNTNDLGAALTNLILVRQSDRELIFESKEEIPGADPLKVRVVFNRN